MTETPSPYLTFDRRTWSELRGQQPLTLSAAELAALRGVGSVISVDDVTEVYLPVTRLLSLRRQARGRLRQATSEFLGHELPSAPYLVGLAGSVAVGKSTTARVLQALISRWPGAPRVELVTTDGFLLPNAELEARGLMQRKGFPESYDRAALLRFVADLKSGVPEVRCPVYSHLAYDVLPEEARTIERPDVVIIDGLNVLQTGRQVCVSDFFDFSIYMDADLNDLRRWYVERFLKLRDTAFQRPGSYFRRYAALSDEQARTRAGEIWSGINEVNLVENILHSRERADLILLKGADHLIHEIRLRRE